MNYRLDLRDDFRDDFFFFELLLLPLPQPMATSAAPPSPASIARRVIGLGS
jgi:hypothetical protein